MGEEDRRLQPPLAFLCNLRKQEEEQIKSKISRRKEIIKLEHTSMKLKTDTQ